jgi:hypothetical protein
MRESSIIVPNALRCRRLSPTPIQKTGVCCTVNGESRNAATIMILASGAPTPVAANRNQTGPWYTAKTSAWAIFQVVESNNVHQYTLNNLLTCISLDDSCFW